MGIPAIAVVDASMVSALVFGEPAAEEAAGKMAGLVLVAPTILPSEVANAGVKKVASGSLTSAQARAGVTAFLDLAIVLREPEVLEIFDLALRTKLSAYDAAYLFLALETGADLLTLDGKLERTFRRLRPRVV